MAKAKLYGGRWKVSRPLSAGGQGDVYLVQDSTGVHEGQWVLKRLRNSERLGRFAHEIKALERLQSVRVPKVVDHSLGEPAFLVYKQVGDETLDSACRRYPLGLERSLRIFEQVVEATVDAHKLEIAHRDIKPNNVCITSDFMHAFLIDFGICQLVDSQLILTATDEPLGNALFAAPECSPGSDLPPGLHSDVYSLGKLLFWMTSAGGHIHREDISPSIVSKIVHSSEVAKFHVGRLLHGCINADPAHRWTSAELLEMTLEVKQTIDELAAREKRGLFTVWDGLGLNGSFNSSSSRSVTRKPRGNPPDDYEFALRFLVPGDVDVELESVAVAIRGVAGTVPLCIAIRADAAGAPSDGLPLEELYADVLVSRPRLIQVASEQHSVLRAGAKYWVHFSVGQAGAEVAVLGAPENFMPRSEVFAERASSSPWEVRESSSGPGHGFRVLGRAQGSGLSFPG